MNDQIIVPGQLIWSLGTTELWSVPPERVVKDDQQCGTFKGNDTAIVISVMRPTSKYFQMQQVFLVTSSGQLGWLYDTSIILYRARP